MNNLDYLAERLAAENNSPEVRQLVIRYVVEDTIEYGEEALAARIAVCIEAHRKLPPDDFDTFLAAILLREAMAKEPSLYKMRVVHVS